MLLYTGNIHIYIAVSSSWDGSKPQTSKCLLNTSWPGKPVHSNTDHVLREAFSHAAITV